MAVVLACLLAGVTVALGVLVLVLRSERSKLAGSERRSRLGAEHARMHLSVLARAGDQLAGALESYDESLRRLVDVVVPSFADWFAVDLMDESGLVRRVVPPGSPHRHPEGDRLVKRVIDAGQAEVFSAVAPDITHDGSIYLAGTDSNARPAAHIGSMVIVPVHVRGLTLGALSFVTTPGRRGYRRSDLETAHGLADRVAVAVERVLLWRESRQAEEAAIGRADQLRRLMEAALAVNAPLAEPEVLRVLATHARRVLGAANAWVGTVPRAPDEQVIAAVSSPEVAPHEVSETVPAACRLVARLNRPVRSTANGIEGGEDTFDASVLPPGDGRAWLAVPVPNPVDDSERVIVVQGAPKESFEPEDESVLVLLAQIASVALVNAHLYQEMRTSERRLRAVVESSPLAIAELSPEGSARWWNSAADLYFGGAATGEVRRLMVDTESRDAWEEVLLRARNAMASVGTDVRVRSPEGDPADLSVSSAPLLGYGGEVTGIVVVAEDITERRMVVEQMHQSERLNAMARLAGGLAHDFNNLLTVILGSSELLASRPDLDDTWREDLDAIQRAGRRAAALTAQLLAIGRNRAREPVPLDPDAVISSMTPMLERVLGDEVKLEVEPAPGEVSILVDPADLERAVLNLAINARDAMPSGGRFRVQTRGAGDQHHRREGPVRAPRVVAISATDTGEGMDDHTAKHCLEPFFSTKGHSQGTGLGLFAVQAIVTQAGGQVTLESAPGKGTTFTLWFPIYEGPASEETWDISGDLLGQADASNGTHVAHKAGHPA